MNLRMSDYAGNRPRTMAVQGLRRSGASGTHAAGSRKERGRRASKRAAIRFSKQAE